MHIRKSMFYFTFLLPCIVVLTNRCTKSASEEKTNFLFIFIDDLGWTAPSCYGNEHVQTVHIDRLAAEGIRFTDAYVTPQCTPSRAALMTGQHTARNRMWHVIPKYDYPYARLKEPEYTENMPRETYTLAKALKENGYTTALLGKWHLTHNQDGYYTYLFDSVKHYYGFDYVNPMTDPTEYQARGDKGVNFLTEEAMKFMETNKDHPFFIYLSHHTIHGPVLAPDNLINKYLQLGYPEKGVFNATYLAAIEHLDHSIGRLLDKLDELRITEKTMVIFLSDNGGVDREFDNAPLRYGKGSAYEGGIRVPLIIRWPNNINPGSVSNVPVHIIDFFPTLVELAGGKIRDNAILDGLSLVPLLKQTSPKSHAYINQEPSSLQVFESLCPQVCKSINLQVSNASYLNNTPEMNTLTIKQELSALTLTSRNHQEPEPGNPEFLQSASGGMLRNSRILEKPAIRQLADAVFRDRELSTLTLLSLTHQEPGTIHTHTHFSNSPGTGNRELYWYIPLYDTLWGATPAAVVRQGKYKLIEFFGDYIDLEQGGKYIPEGRVELYDLENDIGETINLAEEIPELKEEMLILLHDWLEEMEVPLPTLNPDYDEERALERGKR